MKKFLLSIFAVMLAVFSVQADEYSYTLAKGDGTEFGDVTWNEVEWNISANNTSYCEWDGSTSKGYQFGSGSNPCETLTLSTSGIKGTITKIVVNTSGAKSIAATARVTVGGADFGEVITLTNTATDYTFTGTASGDIVLSYTQTSSKAIYIKSITVTYTIGDSGEGEGGDETPETPVAPAAPTLPAACNFDDAMTVEITGIAEGATAYYSLNDENNWIAGSSVEITETTTVYAKVVKDGVSSTAVSETYTKNTPVTPPAEGEVVDVINIQTIGIDSYGSYTSWTGVQSNSSAVYAGQSHKNGDAVQLKSKDSTSGIVTTKSGGKAKKIVVEWNSGTESGRTLDVYGKNSAYASASDLYDSSKRGTKIGSIICGTSTELTIDDDYEYIGLRSYSGAMYLTSISITWDESAGVTPVAPNAPVLTESQSFSGSMTVTITSDATVYYTTDETTPSKTNGTEYTAPFEITATTTVKAVAVNEVGESEVAEATYTYIEPIDLSDCTVAEAIEAFKNGQTGEATITGYIVGAADGALTKAQFTSETSVESNILIADNADEENVDNCMPIKLASGTVVRNALNLKANKNVYKKKITIKCELEAYFSVAGTQTVETAGLYWNVTDAGYATLYLGYKVVIPETVKAYLATGVADKYVALSEVTGILPANTGLILEGEGEHLFNITSKAATVDVEANLLAGTLEDTEIAKVEGNSYYILADGEEGIGLYKPTIGEDATKFNNAANKAYLVVPTAQAEGIACYSFRFGEGTTGIDQITDNREQSTAIYDLTGRRVEAVTAPGIYVVGGKKVLVK